MAAKGRFCTLRAELAEERSRFSKFLDQVDEALDHLEPSAPAAAERKVSFFMHEVHQRPRSASSAAAPALRETAQAAHAGRRVAPEGAGSHPSAAWDEGASGRLQNGYGPEQTDADPAAAPSALGATQPPLLRPQPSAARPPATMVPDPRMRRSLSADPRSKMRRAASDLVAVATGRNSSRWSSFRRSSKAQGGGSSEPKARATTHRQVFANADQMKDQVQKAILEPDYNVKNFYKEKGMWQAVARSWLFDVACISAIVLNALWLGVETHYNDEALLVDADPPFVVVEMLFCTFFVGELLVRFMAFKIKADVMKDSWFVFDSVLVSLMALETWIISLLVWMTAGSLATSSSSTSILRVVRLFRMTRAARVARLLKAVPELMVIGRGIVIVARTVVVIMCLLVMIVYTFGIVFTQLAKGTDLGDTICSGMLTTMSTLLLGGILPDWKPVTDEMAAEEIFFAVLFLMFVLLAYVTVMNMLIGVLVEVVAVVSSVEKETNQVAAVKRVLLKWAPQADKDYNNTIDVDEFKDMLSEDGCAKDLNDVGVDAIALIDAADFIYRDKDALTFSDLLTVVLGLRGKNETRVQDIVQLRKFLHVELQRMELCMESLHINLVGDPPRLEDVIGNGAPAAPPNTPNPPAAPAPSLPPHDES